MEANNFEKNTKLVFDDFLIQPSDKVWHAIEAKINKKNTPFFYWLPACICSIIFMLCGLAVHDVSVKITLKGIPLAANNYTFTQKISNIAKQNVMALKNQYANVNSSNVIVHNAQQHANTKVTLHALPSKKSKDYVQAPIPTKSKIELANNEVTDINSNTIENDTIQSIQQALVNNINDSIGNNTIVAVEKTLSNVVTPNKINKPTKALDSNIQVHQAQKKWKFGLSLQVGVSSANKGFFNNVVNTDYSNVNTTSGIGSAVGNTGFSTVLVPSRAVSIGAIAQYYFNKKNSISIGLQYNYTSSVFAITLPNDSMVNFADASVVMANNYVNQFHAIALPINYCYSIIKNKKVKWQVQVGGQIAQLIQTNALQFNAAQGIFYTNNSLFNTTNLNATAAIHYNIFNGKKGAWFIGPTFTYGVTPLSNQGYYKQVHQQVIGINIQKFFTK